MIRALFLPDEMFAQKIVGLEIGKYTVSACKAVKKGQITTIEKIVTANIEANPEATNEEQIIIALKQVLDQVTGDHIRVSLANNQVFFKEMTIPFLDAHQIKMILGYEIESSLPFALSEAIYDFIIIKQDKIKKESTILVVIAQKSYVNYIIDLIQQTKTKLKISTITIDLLGTLNLYHLLYAAKPDQYQIMLDLGKTCITISYLWQGEPWLVRNLPYGINTLISKIMHDSHQSYQDVVENLIRFGLEQPNHRVVQEVFGKLASDLIFTINSFRLQLTANQPIKHILVCESAIEVKNIAHFLANKINLECDRLELNKVGFHKNLVLTTGITIHPTNLPCLLATTITSSNCDFNLLPPAQMSHNLLHYQIMTALILTISVLGAVCGIGFVKNQALNKTLSQYQKETISELKSAFHELEGNNLTNVINDAESKVNREKKIWFSFSNQNRYSTLKYLQILSNTLDVDKLNLDLKKLIIKDDVITLQGSVAHDEDIAPFEQALSPIFKITSPQSTNFDIKMTLKQNDGDGAA